MKEKLLELNHLVPYLPYSICIEITTYNGKRISYSWSLKCCSDYLISEYNDGIKKGLTLTQIKPILKPLSDLRNHSCYELLSNNLRFNIDMLGLPNHLDLKVNDYNILLENHFDVFGLIEKGLAVNINNL